MRVDVLLGSAVGWVDFSGPVGDGVGLWRGVEDPTEGRFDVELDVNRPVNWSSIGIVECSRDDRVEVNAADPALVDVVGRVLDCDEEGVLSLVIGSTHLLLDTMGDPILGVVGRQVCVSGLALEVFPYEL